jgi:hypothetical protein
MMVTLRLHYFWSLFVNLAFGAYSLIWPMITGEAATSQENSQC